MARNFGMTSGSAPGAQPQTRSHARATTPRDSSDYELGGFLLFAGIVLLPVVIVLSLVMAYMVFRY